MKMTVLLIFAVGKVSESGNYPKDEMKILSNNLKCTSFGKREKARVEN